MQFTFLECFGEKKKADITDTCNMQIISILFSYQICQTDGPGSSVVYEKSDTQVVQKVKQINYCYQKEAWEDFVHQQPQC